MAVFAQALDQSAQLRAVQVYFAARGNVGLVHVIRGQVGALRSVGVTLVAVAAMVIQKRVDMGLEETGILGEVLAVSRVLDWRFFQFRGAAAQSQAFACPGADPGADLVGTELRVGFPAVMPTGHFLNHLRGRRLVEVDQRVCR